MTRPVALCVFAHPDDESFGPSGSIHELTITHDTYIVCITRGDAGENHHPDQSTSLEHLRRAELESSSRILGVKKVFFLGYADGELSNNKYHEVAADIQAIMDDLRPEVVLTMEHRGISGHIDHIATAMITSYLYEKLSYIKKVMFYALRRDQMTRKPGEYFIYFPPGLDPSQIDETHDVTAYMDLKKQAISQHVSQTKDMKRILATLRHEECFYTMKRS